MMKTSTNITAHSSFCHSLPREAVSLVTALETSLQGSYTPGHNGLPCLTDV
jgi:hypothetical protein